MLKLGNTKYLLLLIALLALVGPATRAQEGEYVTLDVTATERDGSVHKLIFDARVHPRIAQVLAGTDQTFESRWTQVELMISQPASGSRWQATAAEYRLPHGGKFEGWSGDTLRFEWAPDANKGLLQCQLSRPAKRNGGASGRFTGRCHDPRYTNRVLLTLTMDRPRAQRPGAPWPDRPRKPIPPKPPSTAPLLIRWTSDLEPVWRESGNPAHEPITFYRAVARDGFCGVGHLAQNHQATRGKALMVKENPYWNQRGPSQSYGQSHNQKALLAAPLDYIRVGWNRGPGSDQGWAIWQPVAALGYHCLGGVVTRGFDPPSRDEIVCLRSDLLTEGRTGDLIWEHRSRGGFQDLTLFESRSDNGHPLGTFLTQQRSRQYAAPVARWVPRYDVVSEEIAHTHREKRFVDQADGTVLDRETGLVWLRQTDCISERGAESAARSVRSLHHGTCGLTDDSRVGDWRLPTRDEWLKTQGRAERQGCRFPALTDPAGSCLPRDQTPFSGNVLSARRAPKGSSSGVCWLSSTGPKGNPQVMSPGRGGWSDSHDPRDEGCVWPVRIRQR